MTQKIIDFSKGSVQYLLTLVFAALGTYVGMKINIEETRVVNKYQDQEILYLRNEQKDIKKDIAILWNTTLSLQIDNAIVCRQLGIERTRSDKSPGKE